MILRVLLAFSLAAVAVTSAGGERFVIERIEVRNATWVRPEVIRAETLLREGSEVSEEDVRAGVRRLTRTPFVFAAAYSLEPGSDDAHRILAVTITENTRRWGLVDGRFTEFHQPSDMLDYEYPDPSAEWKDAAAGLRWMFGDGSLAHLGMTVLRTRLPISKNYSAYELGYTRHHLLGTRFFATAIVRSPVDSLDEGTATPEIVVGLPLNANQTLTARLEDTVFRRSTTKFNDTAFERLHYERTVSGAWTFDTRDQAYAPMSGTYVRIEPGVWMSDFATFRRVPPPQQYEPVAAHSKAFRVDLVAEQHWPISDASSWSASLESSWARVRDRDPSAPADRERWHTSYEVVRGGYGRRLGASLLQLEGRLFLRQVSLEDWKDEIGPDLSATSYEASAAWVQRRRWGTVRIGVTWVSDPGGS